MLKIKHNKLFSKLYLMTILFFYFLFFNIEFIKHSSFIIYFLKITSNFEN